MNNNNLNNGHYANDEIDLRQLAKSLKERSRFIFGVTGIFTLVAIVYVLATQPPTSPAQFRIETSFLKPSDSVIFNLNKFQLLNETKDSIYTRFLNLVNSKSFQKNVFLEGNYANKLNETNEPIADVEEFASEIINSTQLSVFESNSKGNDKYQAELPYVLSIKGNNPTVLSEYLDEVASKASQRTVLNITNLEQQMILNRLEEITIERDMLIAKAKEDRLSEILRIKEKDAQKIRELNDLIERARYKAKIERMNDIQILTDAAKLARSMGIIESNLEKIIENNNYINFDLTAPEWYLFGEKALLKRVQLLKSRDTDDPFIPELVDLKNQINEIQNNNLLKTLEERQDDSPFITFINAEGKEINLINELEVEAAKLKSIIRSNTGIDAMQVHKYASAQLQPIQSNNRNSLLIVSTLFGSFVASIFLALIMNLFKEEETNN